MSYDVLVVKNPNNGYTARLLAWPALVAHAETRREAVAKVEEALASVWSEGEIVTIDMPKPHDVPKPQPVTEENPWLANFGRFKDDPTFDDLLDEIAQYRRSLEVTGDAQ